MASSCESDFLVLGLQPGEEFYVPIRTVATIVTITVASAWCSLEKIKRLRLFFAHWLSGLVMSLAVVIDDMMIDVCWTSKNMEGFIKTIKFIEFSGSNMLAITNLAICVNLALIVLSHRTMNRVKSLSSAGLTLTFLVISMSIAAASIPFCDVIIVAGTAFLVTSYDEVRFDVLVVLNLIVEFIAGVCMAIIVTWMLVFRMEGIKECWKLHRRIRYYFILTIIGIVVNLFHGISITIIVSTNKIDTQLLAWSLIFRYIHITLDTIILYGVLRERSMDERGDAESTGSNGMPPGQLLPGGCMPRGGSGQSNSTSKTVAPVPLT